MVVMLTQIKAVIFDFVGTLTVLRGYSYEKSINKMYESLVEDSFDLNRKLFDNVYEQVWQKYRLIRYQKLVEVTNAVWLSEALNQIGFSTQPDDDVVKKAVNVFFRDYFRSLKRRSCAQQILKKLFNSHLLGLITNFTYSPVIYAALRKLQLNRYFNAILISEKVGWRKPHPNVFKEALKRLGVNAEQAVFVGDCPQEDIQGAKNVGMKTVFIPSQFYSIEDLRRSQQKPNATVNSLCGFSPNIA